MDLTTGMIRLAQRALRDAGFDPHGVDGRLGDDTRDALDGALAARSAELSDAHRGAILQGSSKRRGIAWLQLVARDAGLDAGAIDGLWGQVTEHAVEQLLYREEHGVFPVPFRDVTPSAANPHGWPTDTRDQAQLRAFYGEPGQVPLVPVPVPFPHRLSWDLGTKVSRISVHAKVADSLARVLDRVAREYTADRIVALRLDRFGGAYNPRKKRGSLTSWSMHAWGVALDYDPERNGLHSTWATAAFARPEYDAWWAAWEDEGWVSLGRTKNFDWMHVQAARVS